jgi:hypothetical protein
MKTNLWCSIHQPSKDQLAELAELGKIVFLADVNPLLQDKLNNSPIDSKELYELASELISFIIENDYFPVQVGGSIAFQYTLGKIAADIPFAVKYAHSERVSIDEPQADGSVKKISVFKHIKFIIV